MWQDRGGEEGRVSALQKFLSMLRLLRQREREREREWFIVWCCKIVMVVVGMVVMIVWPLERCGFLW